MHARQLLTWGLGIVLLTALLGVWVVPAVASPKIACGDIAPAPCDRLWRATAAETTGLQMILPVTAASVSGTEGCPQVRVEWLWGILATDVEQFC